MSKPGTTPTEATALLSYALLEAYQFGHDQGSDNYYYE